MKYTSNEISDILYYRQMELYLKIHNLIEDTFDNTEPDTLASLIRITMEIEDSINHYKRELKQREMFSNNFIRNQKESI
jgi:hypothetical protein